MELIDGEAISRKILDGIAQEVAQLDGPTPTVAFVRVGEDPASITYLNKKQRVAADLGIESRLHLFPDTITESELLEQIDALNSDTHIHGILVQAPLPTHISERHVFNHVAADKDVDGFSATNLGMLCQEDPSGFIACTPAGIAELLAHANVETEGKHIVVVGRSLIVGKPMALLMLRRALPGNATVTICHSKTTELSKITQQADILIAAIGQAQMIRGAMIKPGAVVIDVGMNRLSDVNTKRGYRLVGDIHYPEVSAIASKITPVPGGVGPMTVAMLMSNTLKAYKKQKGLS